MGVAPRDRLEAEEAREKNEPFDASKITEPKQVVRIDGTGAQILD